MSRVIVIGGGAAGMMAAYSAAQSGHQVILLEKNEKLGKKLFITGKGRCNLTNVCSMENFFTNIVMNEKFLYSSLYQFDAQAMISFLEENRCEVKVERGERAFPASDHSSDVIKALQMAMKKAFVKVKLHTECKKLLIENNQIIGIMTKENETMEADAVILACGGLSYPATGSTGDGYRLAEQAGHSLTRLAPSLVPLEIEESWCSELQGLSLKNVGITLKTEKEDLYHGFGEMLFTHFGVSGPLILTASSYYAQIDKNEKATILLDLKPALDLEKLDKRILREFEENNHKEFKNSLHELFPMKLIPVIIALSGIPEDCRVYDIGREKRRALAGLIKALPMTVTGTRGYEEAVITQGGIRVQEVNPSTMQSKICSCLFFAGEILDLDALTGGFNLQIAWSTGHLAGSSIPW